MDSKMEFGQIRQLREDVLKERVAELNSNPPGSLLRLTCWKEPGVSILSSCGTFGTNLSPMRQPCFLLSLLLQFLRCTTSCLDNIFFRQPAGSQAARPRSTCRFPGVYLPKMEESLWEWKHVMKFAVLIYRWATEFQVMVIKGETDLDMRFGFFFGLGALYPGFNLKKNPDFGS